KKTKKQEFEASAHSPTSSCRIASSSSSPPSFLLPLPHTLLTSETEELSTLTNTTKWPSSLTKPPLLPTSDLTPRPRKPKICFHSRAVNTISNLGLVKKRYGTQLLQLLAEDAALKPFKSYKQSVKKLKKVGDILTIVVVAGCCYEIYVKAAMREAARRQ
ncbi:uncharacterized protein, partial [Arachis hypogaea]|uniref:uncharacterized protein n=1 Tax=Arachis hypogaea TaxID=3818 RepID=UPI003B2115C8